MAGELIRDDQLEAALRRQLHSAMLPTLSWDIVYRRLRFWLDGESKGVGKIDKERCVV